MNINPAMAHNYNNKVLQRQSSNTPKVQENPIAFADTEIAMGKERVSSPVSGAPKDVQAAWENAKKETSTNPMGIGADGKMTHISATFAMRAEQYYKTGNDNLFGNTHESALSMAKQILDRIENPLDAAQDIEGKKRSEQEKAFYEKFIANLGKETLPPKEVSPVALYEQMTGQSIG